MTLAMSTKRFGAQTPSLSVVDAVAGASLVPLTVDQYARMIRDGIVSEDASVELLRGVMVRKDRSSPGEEPTGHSPLRSLVISLLIRLARGIENPQRFVRIQLPVVCPPDGAPEPDASVTKGSERDYANRLPTARDVFSIIEAAHSSIGRDQEDKLPIYAAAGVLQYVIINLNNDTVEVYEDPDPTTEQYRTKMTVDRGGRVRLLVGDNERLEFDPADVLP
jgi:Uma2 family endonuclease